MDGYAYVDIARSGETNMAIDRELLEAAERQQCAWVRLYRWAEPTLSLGRFQATIDRSVHLPSAQLPKVLRASGGGAIVHHHEWTYSLAVPVGRNQVGAAPQLYDLVHDALVAGLRDLGWDAAKWKAAQPEAACSTDSQVSASARPREASASCGSVSAASGQAQFLCFSRRSCGDIVCNGFKVVGSAQRRLGSSVLQHGSILYDRSEFAPELPGLAQLPRSPDSGPPALRDNERSASSSIVQPQLGDDRFAELVLAWLIAGLSQNLPIAFERLAAPPARGED